MEKKSYQIISGDTWDVEASSGKEALEKFYAWAETNICPCEVEDCDCVRFGEANTLLIDADPENPEA
ncbi:MAG: hypothetical protein EBR82_59075 [Caulobacteraceae bacterium]|nr:hypothetical protein [Caulobacteraceae bacterium]